jgi:hypothetical protein
LVRSRRVSRPRSKTRGQCHGQGSGKPKVNVRFKDNVNVKDIVKVMEISRSYLEQVRAEHGKIRMNGKVMVV